MRNNRWKNIIWLLLLLLLILSGGCGISIEKAGESSNLVERDYTRIETSRSTTTSSSESEYAPETVDTENTASVTYETTFAEMESGESITCECRSKCATEIILFNEIDDGERGLFYLGQSLENVYAILDSWGVDRQSIEHIESTGDFDDWHWGYTSIFVEEFGLSFFFDLTFATVDISISACDCLCLRGVTKMGLEFGDSYERMVRLYGNGYTRFIPEFWGDEAILFEYNFGSHYFRVFATYGEVIEWGMGIYSYGMLSGYRNAEVEVVQEFATTVQIHQDIRPLTFYRRIMYPVHHIDEFPEPTAVEVVIKNEIGIIFQVIQNLTQSAQFLNSELSFSDYNFDGYLDMRLMRWQENDGKLITNEYFWLWDNMLYKFVLNEQLMEIGRATRLYVNQETSQIEVWYWTGPGSTGCQVVYEYRGGVFIRTY